MVTKGAQFIRLDSTGTYQAGLDAATTSLHVCALLAGVCLARLEEAYVCTVVQGRLWEQSGHDQSAGHRRMLQAPTAALTSPARRHVCTLVATSTAGHCDVLSAHNVCTFDPWQYLRGHISLKW